MQNGDPKSFTHIFTINVRISSIGQVAGFRKNGAPLLVKKKALRRQIAGFRKNGAPRLVKKRALKGNQLIVYEPNSKQINYTGITGPFSHFFASHYTQTLLLLDHKDSVDSETAPIDWKRQAIDEYEYGY